MKTGAFVWRAVFTLCSPKENPITELVLTEGDAFSDVYRALQRKYSMSANSLTLRSAECLGFGVYPLTNQ